MPQRIGDAERDRAADYLREHMSVGRLSQDEFDERVTAALQARTAADLEPLFSDLPAPKPGQDVRGRGRRPLAGLPARGSSTTSSSPAVVPMPDSTLANVLAAALRDRLGPVHPQLGRSAGLWWFVFIPILLSSLAGKQRQELNRREALWQKRQNPQLPPGSPDRLRPS